MLPYEKRNTPPHAVILSEAARDSASAFASRFCGSPQKFDKLRMTRAAQSKPAGQPHTRLDLVGRKCYIMPIRVAEDVDPYIFKR